MDSNRSISSINKYILGVHKKLKHWHTRHRKLVNILTLTLLFIILAGCITGGILYAYQKEAIAVLQSDKDYLQSQNNDLQAQVDNLQIQNGDLTQQVKDLQDEVDELQSETGSIVSTTRITTPSMLQVCGSLPPISLHQQSPDEFNNAMNTYSACTKQYFKDHPL